MLFAMNLMIVPVILVGSSFLISVCMFIVPKALLTSSATVIVRAGGAIWLNPFAIVLFNVCSDVTVECCVLHGCVLYVCCYVRKKALVVSTHSLDPYLWGESDHPAFGPPASISFHLASSSITPAGSVHKSRDDSGVRMWVQLKRWYVCGCCRGGLVVMDVIWRRLCVSMI